MDSLPCCSSGGNMLTSGEAAREAASPASCAGARILFMPTDPTERARLLARRRARWLERVLDGDAQAAYDRGYRAALDVVYRTPAAATRAQILSALHERAPWEQRYRRIGRRGGGGAA